MGLNVSGISIEQWHDYQVSNSRTIHTVVIYRKNKRDQYKIKTEFSMKTNSDSAKQSFKP